MFKTLAVDINSLTYCEAKNEAKKRPSNTIKNGQKKQKKTVSYIISEQQTDTVRQKNVKNKLTILLTIIMVKFNNKLI